MNKKYPTLLTVVLFFGFFSCGKKNPTDNSELGVIETVMRAVRVEGVSIAVIKDFKVDHLEVYGIKSKRTQEPVTEQTLFQAASISKSVAAFAALKFVQDGVLSLDDDINLKLSSWQVPENSFTSVRKVSLKRLLSHTAGTTVHGFPGYEYNHQIPSLLQVLNGAYPANTAQIAVDMVPGTVFRYSGGGYCIAQQVMIDVAQKSFPDILQEVVLSQLDMLNSTYEQPLPEGKINNASSAHDSNGNMVAGNHHIYPEMAAAGLWTTPEDLAKFLIEIQLSLDGTSNKVLNKELTEEMVTPVIGNYALGLGIQEINGEIYFGHGGANEGFRCLMTAHKNSGDGAVVMTNNDNGDACTQTIIEYIAQKENWPGYR